MSKYSIGDVERIVGVDKRTIRTWEKYFSLLCPVKSLSGRREYTETDLQILIRLRHLVIEKKYTLEGAEAELVSERTGTKGDIQALFFAVRSELVKTLFALDEMTKKLDAFFDKNDSFSSIQYDSSDPELSNGDTSLPLYGNRARTVWRDPDQPELFDDV